MSASGTYNDNTVIVNAGRDIVVIRGWRGILGVRLRVDSDIETCTSIGWSVYSHPEWMEGRGTTVERCQGGCWTQGIAARSQRDERGGDER